MEEIVNVTEKDNQLTRFGFKIIRQSMGQYHTAALRNCYTGQYGFEDKDSAVNSAVSVMKDFEATYGGLLYAEVYQVNTYDNEDLSVPQPSELLEVVVYDPSNKHGRAAYFKDDLFPNRYLQMLKTGKVNQVKDDAIVPFEPDVEAFASPAST